jgi:uncharacterized protein (DUF952 family)
MVLLVDEHKLDVTVPLGGSHPGATPDTLFPHVYGRINRDAAQGMMEVQRDTDGHAVVLAVWS